MSEDSPLFLPLSLPIKDLTAAEFIQPQFLSKPPKHQHQFTAGPQHSPSRLPECGEPRSILLLPVRCGGRRLGTSTAGEEEGIFNEGFSHTMKSWPQDMIRGISCRQKLHLSLAEQISWKTPQSSGVRWYHIFVFQTVCHRQWESVRVGLTGLLAQLWPVSHLPRAQPSWCMQPHFSKE